MSRLSLNDLLPNTNYAIRIRAVGPTGVSEWSNRQVFMTITDQVLPSTPGSPTWTAQGDSFHGEWNAVTTNVNGDVIPVTRYEVELVANSLTRIDSVPAATGSTKVTYDLSFEMNRALFTNPQATVTFRVRAVDNKELKSDWTTVISQSNAAPQPPTAVTAVAGQDRISLTWTPPADNDIIGYNVYNTAGTLLSFVNATAFVYNTTTYSSQTLKVAAVDKFGQVSTLANANAVTPQSPFVTDTTPPDVPTITSANIINNANGIGAKMTVVWTQNTVSDLAGFALAYRKVGTTPYQTITVNEPTTRTITIDVDAFTNYEVIARSFDKQLNYSSFGATATIATSPANAIPATVASLSGSIAKDTLTLTWPAVADLDIKNYEVDISTSSTFASGNLNYKTGTSTTLTASGLSTNTPYYARVRAVDVAGSTSAAWTTLTGQPLTSGTYPVTPLSDGVVPASSPAATVTPKIGSLFVSWTPVANADLVTYEVHISTTNGFTPNAGTKAGETMGTFVTLENTAGGTPLAYGTTYYVKLIAKDKDGANTTPGTQASGAPLKVAATDSNITAADVGAPTVTQFNTAIKTYVNEYYLSTSETTQTGGSWSTTPPTRTPGTFIWERVVVTKQDNTTTTSTPVLTTGNSGAAGSPGSPGSPGAAGVGIAGTTVTYQTHTNGTTAPTGAWSSSPTAVGPGQYLWTRTVTTYTDASTPTTAYSVGAAGVNGTNGTNGTNGSNGVGIANTVVTYQTHTNGTTAPTGAWSSSPTAVAAGQYLWTRTVTSYTDASTPTTAYSVGAAGANGAPGSNGVGITGTVVDYQVGSSGTSAPTGAWSSTPVATTAPGQFLWTRTVTSYSNSTTTTAYAISAHGATGTAGSNGTNGTNGTNGVGVTGTVVEYQVGSSPTSAPTGAWSSTPQATTPGTYLWTRTTTSYSNSTTSIAYSVAAHGSQGPAGSNGTNGTNGTNGVSITSVTPYWAQVAVPSSAPTKPANNVTTPSAPWVSTEPGYTINTDLYTTEKITYSDGTTNYTTVAKSSSYAAALVSANGVNRIYYSNSVASGTADSNGRAYINTDVWFQRDGNGIIIGSWEFVSGSWVVRRFGNATLDALDVGKLTSGSISTADIAITSGGAIRSTDYNQGTKTGWRLNSGGLEIWNGVVSANTLAANSAIVNNLLINPGGSVQSSNYSANTAGWRINNTGIEMNDTNSKIKADAIITGNLGGPAGVNSILTIAANTSLLLSGGHIKSGTYNGNLAGNTTQFFSNANAGFYLGNDGLIIAQGTVKAEAFAGGTFTAGTITMGAGGAIAGPGFTLNSTGLSVLSGSINAAALNINVSRNIMPPYFADFEGVPSGYTALPTTGGGAIMGAQAAFPKFGTQKFGAVWNSQATNATFYFAKSTTDYNVPTEAGKTYIFSAYTWSSSAINSTLQVKWSNGTIENIDSQTMTSTDNPTAAVRLAGVKTAPAGTNGCVVMWTSTSTNVAAGFSIDGIMVEEKTGNTTTPSTWNPPSSTTIYGGQIRTGSIVSDQTAQVTKTYATYDESGNINGYGAPVTVNDGTRPAWSINTNGSAEFSNLSIRGNTVLGQPDTVNATEAFGLIINTTSGSTNIVTIVDGTFKAGDIGLTITGTNIPANTTITAVNSFGSAATLSNAATATAGGVGASILRPIRYVSTVSSANYIEGSQGWTIRSDGYAEFRELAAESIHGAVIEAGTLRAEAIVTGTLNADLTLSGSFKTSTMPTDINIVTSNGSTTLTMGTNTPTQEFALSDIGATITGPGIPTGTIITAWTSTTSVTISAAATATVAAPGAVLTIYRGRTVSISGDGIVLADAGGRPVVTLPTDPLASATFAGSIVADDIYIRDEFRMFGIKNSLGNGAALNLDAGSYIPTTGPRVTFAYDNLVMTKFNSTERYRPDTDAYVNNPKSAIYDDVNKQYYYTFEFYGTRVARNFAIGSGIEDGMVNFGIDVSKALSGGVSAVPRGGMALNASNFYFLTYDQTAKVWRHEAITRSGMNRAGGPIAADRVMSHEWTQVGTGGAMSGYPAFAQYGGKTYVVKRRASDQRLILQRHPDVQMNTTPEISVSSLVVAGNIQSLVVGKFDFDATNVYAVVTTSSPTTGVRQNYVFLVGTSTMTLTNYSFPIAFDESPIGTVYVGSSNDDSTGHFRTIGINGRISKYTQLAKTDANTTGRVAMKWRNDGTNAIVGATGGTGAKGVSLVGPIAPYSIQRRSKTVFTSPTAIPDAGGDTPNSVTFLAGVGPSGTLYALAEPAKGVITQTITAYPTVDAGGITTTTLRDGVPAKLTGSNGLEISGLGDISARNYNQNGTAYHQHVRVALATTYATVTTSRTNIVAATVNVASSNDVFYVHGNFDVLTTTAATASTSTSSVFIGSLVMDGAVADYDPSVATFCGTSIGMRGTVSQTWRVTGLTAGTHTFRLAAYKTAGTGVYSVMNTHTNINIHRSAGG